MPFVKRARCTKMVTSKRAELCVKRGKAFCPFSYFNIHVAPSLLPKSTAAERLSHAATNIARYTHHPAKSPRPLGYTYPLASRNERRCAVLA
jgi:hypothetical protein